MVTHAEYKTIVEKENNNGNNLNCNLWWKNRKVLGSEFVFKMKNINNKQTVIGVWPEFNP